MPIEITFSADTEPRDCEGCKTNQLHARGMYRMKPKQPRLLALMCTLCRRTILTMRKIEVNEVSV